jgi:triphosphoribosyl-dephospho-CoA synthase
MRLAADRDLIARQYATGYHDLFSLLVPTLEHGLASGHALEQAIVHTHLTSLAELGDTLILRKCGPGVAEDARRQAREVLDRGWPVTPGGTQALCDYDRWLRAEGHRRNPGTTADLVAGALFLALRKGSIELPLTRPWDCPAL